MPNSDTAFDVIVVGAGAIGTACALRLSQSLPGVRVALVEGGKRKCEETSENQRVWALGYAAMELLDSLGIKARLGQNSCYPYSRMQVWDENSNGELCFDAEELNQKQLGWMTDAEEITAVLQTQASESQAIEVFFEHPLEAIEWLDDQVLLQSTGSPSLTARLVVAADGANSWLRRQAGILATRHTYEQQGVVARIRTELSHEDTAWQRFLKEGPLAVLPLANNFSSIVWSTSQDHASQLLSCEESEFEQQLAFALERRLGDVTLAGQRLAFPLQSRQAECYVGDRLVLVGDAAHSIHPLAGQGANLGFQDVAALVDILHDQDDLAAPSLLQRYQRLRRPANLQTDWLMTSLHYAYQFNGALWPLVRGQGMNWLSSSSLIKNWLAKQAMGIPN